MDREGFLDTIRKQYVEDIHEMYIECMHSGGHVVDYTKLVELLGKLMQNAKVDGLPSKEFEELVQAALPQLQGKVFLQAVPVKKAA